MRNFEFEELIERAFSIGYECALEDLEEQREFSEKEDKPKKLSTRDKMDIWAYKNLYGKKYRKASIEELDEKEPVGKIMARDAKMMAKIGAIEGGLIGGIGGALMGKDTSKSERIKNSLKYGGGLALAGGGIGGYIGGMSSAVGVPIRRSLRKKSSKDDELWKKEQDKMRVADGQMTREEFLEKWG
jgi:hypothetical protein